MSLFRALFLSLALVAGVEAQAAPAPAPAAAAQVQDYRMGVGDTLHIVVYQNPDLTLDARLTDNGLISFPLIGSVKLGGLTVPEAESLIANGLRKGDFVKNPQVTIVIVQVRGSQVSVLGQVNRPGRYPLEQGDTRLSDVLALAGGAVVQTGSDIVTVVGTRAGKPVRYSIDLPKVFGTAERPDDIVMQNGDVIWVDRAPLVYIYGEVQRPGSMPLLRGMTVMQALAAGGGLTPRGTERGVQIHRRDPATNKVESIKPALDDAVEDGDVIYVRESLF